MALDGIQRSRRPAGGTNLSGSGAVWYREASFNRMKTLFVVLLGAVMAVGASTGRAADRADVRSVPAPDAAGGNRHYAGNRAPLNPSPLIPLPTGAVRPEGWTRRVLQLQNDGFHGHLPALSRFLKREDNSWLSREGRERTVGKRNRIG